MFDDESPDLPPVPAAALLAAIDAEQDDLLRALDQLALQVESLLTSCAAAEATRPEPLAPRRAA
jgi:hypothetical protein